jgi:two-component system, NarL family, sensor histidine kinase UhpB
MNQKLFVLVIEDSITDAELNVRLLRDAGYDVSYQRVETAGEMTEALQMETWDLILSDYSMPHFTVQEALEIYHAQGSDVPFIIISGAIGEVKAVQIIKAGAHDYLLKANMTRFIPVVERELREAANRKELVKVTAALADSEEKHKIYIENAPDVVVVADRKGRFIEVNEAGSRITGYSRNELLKMSILDMITEESLALAQEKLCRLLETGSLNADFEVLHKDGSKRWFAVEAIQLSESRFLGFTQDITDRKMANLEVMKAREELQHLNRYLMDARENERATISMEIHDELGQALTAIKIDLSWVLEHISDSARSFQKISRIIEMTNDTIKKVQRISAELRPGLLDDLGLATAIEWYSGEFEQRTGLTCELSLDDVPDGDRLINLALFRIFQEALTNVIRHAHAKTVRITLRGTPKGTTMTIEDDGVGISKEQIADGKSLGLIGMRERARQMNGTIEFSKNKVAGTKIVTFIPTPISETYSI